MGRIKCGVYRDSGFAKKRDTPLKLPLSGRHKHRRFIPNKHYEALPEEPEEGETTVKPSSAVRTRSEPVQCTTVFPACTKSTRLWLNRRSGAFKGCGISTEEEPSIIEGGQSLTGTPKNSTFSESDTTLSFDNDEEEVSSSTSLSSSSLPSPEIFRKEDSVEEELLGVGLQIKNSTLLDMSNAETIQMHHNPNISSIVDVSTILSEKNCENRTFCREPEVEAQIKTTSANQEQAFKRRLPVIVRKLLLKKKVSFKNPITAEGPEDKHVPVTKSTVDDVISDTVRISSPAEQMKPDMETSGVGEIHFEDRTVHMRVTLKRPKAKRSPEKVKFFDFASDSDRDLFFQRMRERCVKLRSFPLFPLSAPESMDTSVL